MTETRRQCRRQQAKTCLRHANSFAPIAAVVTRSTGVRFPVGSMIGAALVVGSAPHRIVFIASGIVTMYVSNGDGTCVVSGQAVFTGTVTAGRMVTY